MEFFNYCQFNVVLILKVKDAELSWIDARLLRKRADGRKSSAEENSHDDSYFNDVLMAEDEENDGGEGRLESADVPTPNVTEQSLLGVTATTMDDQSIIQVGEGLEKHVGFSIILI